MNIVEVGKLLTIASAYDNRTVSKESAVAWNEVIGDIDFDVAVEAVKAHFRTSTDYLLPAHVVSGARRVREALEREERKSRPALPRPVITLDRERFDREVEAAILAERKRRAEEGIVSPMFCVRHPDQSARACRKCEQ